MTSKDIIAKAKVEVGVTEYPANSNKVKYNTWFYNKEVSGSAYPWCATFISWIFRETNLIKKTASCLDMLEYFEKNGQIVKEPQAGDIVFFKYSTNNRRTNHVGLVISVAGNQIQTIEGNTSLNNQDNGGAVMIRTRSKNIVAFARPKYSDSPVVVNTNLTYPTLKVGSKGDYVTILQSKLVQKGYRIKVDGIFGQNTKIALVDFQAQNNLVKDGICGAKTWQKLI